MSEKMLPILLQIPFGLEVLPLFVIFVFLIVIVIALLTTIFWVMMLVDCAKRDFDDKLIWILIIIFTHFLGATLYYFIVKKGEDKTS